ncbi:hypothetical protein OAA76_01750 [Planktotalea frisia]|nr:hypothetical protein [Planktotalea frisia]
MFPAYPKRTGRPDWLAREADQEIDIDQKYQVLEKWSQFLAASERHPRIHPKEYG